MKFYLLDEDGKAVPGKVGLSTGYLDAPEGVIETDDEWEIAELRSMAATAGHPVSEQPPKPKPSTKKE